MNIKDVTLNQTQVHKLLAAGNADAALLLIYLQSGNALSDVQAELSFSDSRKGQAAALLRQLGLWQEEAPRAILPQQPPAYTEQDVMNAMTRTESFPLLVGEVQRLLGRILTTEELKLLLTFRNYLGLPSEVINLLVSYCKDRLRRRGSNRGPSLRTIEKEAYLWWEKGIATMEDAIACIRAQDMKQDRLAELMKLLQISGRNLTPPEERYATSWLEMNFDREALLLAYEKTCLNTGGLKWAYMNKILTSWHKQGLSTGAQVRTGDHGVPTASGGAARTAAQQTQRVQAGTAGLGEFEREAIARMLREHQQDEKKEG